jgi:hypothetical protein
MGNKRPNHKIVPGELLAVDLENEERHLRQVSEYLKRGALPASYLARHKRKGDNDDVQKQNNF